MTGLLESEKIAHLQAILAEWDIPSSISIETVYEGHPVFKVTTVGPMFMLKEISEAPNLTRLQFTHDVLTHVSTSGLQVPLPIPARSAQFAVNSQGRFYLLYKYIKADEYPNDPELMPELFYQTGQAIARLHEALASYPDKEVSYKTWYEDLAGRIPGWISALSDGLPEPQAALVKRVGLERGVEIEGALRRLPEQLIHRDCHPGNILVQGTRVIGFIDCDHICLGPRLFDLAYYAVHHLKWVTDDKPATQRWLMNLPHLIRGYRSRQSLLPEEVVALPAAMMAYHLLLSHWYMGRMQWEPIALELQALDWIHMHFDIILNATISS